MKLLTTITLLCSCLAAQAQLAQPWSKYQVHDKTRPNPAKVAVKSHVATPPPADADIIFDGKNTNALTKPWTVADGIMIATKAGNNLTKKSFGDCQVHIEWRIPKGRKLKGQIGGNSGIFLMSRYEIQIQESHTNVTYADGQAGAIYGQTPPSINPSLPQGEWQSYDIMFKAPIYKGGKLITPAYVTVLHNGVTVHNHQVLYGPTQYMKAATYPAKHPEKAPIMLQWHGDPIEFKNFWVRDLSEVTKAETPVTNPKK